MQTRFQLKLPADGKAATGPIRSNNGSIRGTGAWTWKPKTGESSGKSLSRWLNEESQRPHLEHFYIKP